MNDYKTYLVGFLISCFLIGSYVYSVKKQKNKIVYSDIFLLLFVSFGMTLSLKLTYIVSSASASELGILNSEKATIILSGISMLILCILQIPRTLKKH